jgi:DNA modification methylase
MRLEFQEVSKLIPSPNQLRKNDHAVEAMARAITEFGLRVPVLIQENGEIVDGHLRYKAALHLGLTTVPAICVEDLNEDQLRAFRISVNKLAGLAKWDMTILEAELRRLQEADFDLTLIGFTEAELDSLFAIGVTTGKDPDRIPDPEAGIAAYGDLWSLGSHRLLVGDAREASSYYRLIKGGTWADMVWTDPPYNVNYEGKAGKIDNDNLSDGDFACLLERFYDNSFGCLKPGGPIYVAHADGAPSFLFRTLFLNAGFYFSTCLIWRKNQSTLGRSDYHFQHEPILYGWKPGASHCWYGGRKRKSIIEFGEPSLVTPMADGSWQIRFNNEVLIVRGSSVSVESIMPTIIEIDKPMQSKEHPTMRSEERRVGKECRRLCRSRWSPYH